MKNSYLLPFLFAFALSFSIGCQKNELCEESYDIYIPIQLTDPNGNSAVSDEYFSNVTAVWPEKEDFGQLDSLPILPYSDTAIYILTKNDSAYRCTIVVDKELYYHSRACGFLMKINDIELIDSEYPGVTILTPSEYEERPFWVFSITVDSL